MEQRLMRKILQIDGMTCISCEMRIENALKKLDGVVEVKAIFSSSNVYVTYDANVIGREQIINTVEKLDYQVKNKTGEKGTPATNTKKAAEDKMTIN